MSLLNDKWGQNSYNDKANDNGYIKIPANTNTLKSEMILKNIYEIDLKPYKSINSLPGFHSKRYTSGINESEHMVNILTINSILVSVDIISGSYVNDSTQPTIYSSFPSVSPGSKTIENPHNLLYLPTTADMIHRITIWLTDQNGEELN